MPPSMCFPSNKAVRLVLVAVSGAKAGIFHYHADPLDTESAFYRMPNPILDAYGEKPEEEKDIPDMRPAPEYLGSVSLYVYDPEYVGDSGLTFYERRREIIWQSDKALNGVVASDKTGAKKTDSGIKLHIQKVITKTAPLGKYVINDPDFEPSLAPGDKIELGDEKGRINASFVRELVIDPAIGQRQNSLLAVPDFETYRGRSLTAIFVVTRGKEAERFAKVSGRFFETLPPWDMGKYFFSEMQRLLFLSAAPLSKGTLTEAEKERKKLGHITKYHPEEWTAAWKKLDKKQQKFFSNADGTDYDAEMLSDNRAATFDPETTFRVIWEQRNSMLAVPFNIDTILRPQLTDAQRFSERMHSHILTIPDDIRKIINNGGRALKTLRLQRKSPFSDQLVLATTDEGRGKDDHDNPVDAYSFRVDEIDMYEPFDSDHLVRVPMEDKGKVLLLEPNPSNVDDPSFLPGESSKYAYVLVKSGFVEQLLPHWVRTANSFASESKFEKNKNELLANFLIFQEDVVGHAVNVTTNITVFEKMQEGLNAVLGTKNATDKTEEL